MVMARREGGDRMTVTEERNGYDVGKVVSLND